MKTLENTLAYSENQWDLFLSYSSTDKPLVEKIQRYLERFKLPDGRRLKIFRDETDIRGGSLSKELNYALAVSGCLAVCCSASSKKSEWVAREIEEFHRGGAERPVVPLILSDDPASVLHGALASAEIRYCDLRPGWGLTGPRKQTRSELIRLIATASENSFRELLPLDELRRRRFRRRSVAAIAVFTGAALLWPVVTWKNFSLEGMQVYGCDTHANGISLYAMNPPQSVKPFFNVIELNTDGVANVSGAEFRPDIALSGRLLPEREYHPDGCGSSSGWIGAPVDGQCISVVESDEMISIDDPMGGFDTNGTEIRIGNSIREELNTAWSRVDVDYWRELGTRVSPSAGLPIGINGDDIWLGLPRIEGNRRSLWHSSNGGRDWDYVRDVDDIDSLRYLDIGLLAAGRINGELGFYLYQDGSFVEYEGPRTGSDLEVCGAINGEPLLRVDQSVFVRDHRPWVVAATN